MSVKYAPSKLRVPDGFQNLLEGLAREVLREQPEDIIKFAAEYFKEQVKLRENGKVEEPVVQKETPEKNVSVTSKKSSVATDKDIVPPTKRDSEVSNKSPLSKKESVASNPPAALERQSTTESVQRENTTSPKPVADTQSSLTEDDAAIKIQAIVRGHKAREEVKAMKAACVVVASSKEGETNEAQDESNSVEQQEAAIKIQSSFRGHQARKEVKALKSALKQELPSTEEAMRTNPEAEDEACVAETVAAVEATPECGDIKEPETLSDVEAATVIAESTSGLEASPEDASEKYEPSGSSELSAQKNTDEIDGDAEAKNTDDATAESVDSPNDSVNAIDSARGEERSSTEPQEEPAQSPVTPEEQQEDIQEQSATTDDELSSPQAQGDTHSGNVEKPTGSQSSDGDIGSEISNNDQQAS